MVRCAVLTLLLYASVHLHSYEDTKRLKDTLFDPSRYRTDVKPVKNQSDSVKVNVSHTLKAVTEVNIPDGYAVVVSELEIKWRDEYLVWNAATFNGIQYINLQTNSFWTPAVKIIDGREDTYDNEERYAPKWVSKEGIVSLYKTVTVKAKLSSLVSFYPFDVHNCLITIISTKYNLEDVELVNRSVIKNTNEDEINTHWEVNNTSSFVKTYCKDEHCFNAIIVSMKVKRRFTFTTIQKTIPIATLMILDMLTPFVPPDSGERVTLCITIVLALIIASDSMTDDELPRDAAEVSLITVLGFIYNFLSVLTVAWSVLIVCLFKRSGKVPPTLIKILKANIKSDNTHVEGNLDQCQDKSPGDDVSVETRQDGEDICDITWQDITKKMDKVYFYCFLGIYIGLNCITALIYFGMGLI